MQAANKNLSKVMIVVPKRSFAVSQNTLLGSVVPDRNHTLRVMSTPTWPVPYYQRSHRHDAVREEEGENVGYICQEVDDFHIMMAKENLKASGKGYVVEQIDNHYDSENFVFKFEDSSTFCRAYVDDLLDCLGVTHEQNSRLLREHDLADCLN